MKLNERSWSPLISCEHATDYIPKKFHPFLRQDYLGTHRALDIGAKDLAKRLGKSLKVQPFYGEVSRLLVDLNRSSTHASWWGVGLVEGCEVQPDKEIIDRYYETFRRSIRESIEREVFNKKIVIHLSIHSFTRNFNGKNRSTDIGILFDNRVASETEFAKLLQTKLKRESDFEVHRNRPYWGRTDGHVSKLRESFKSKYYRGFELEICNDLLIRREEVAALSKIISKCLAETIETQLSK